MSTTTCPECGGRKALLSKRCASCALAGNQHFTVRWPPDRIDELRDRLWVHGETTRQAALGMGVTTNAIIGVMHRHGIPHPNAKHNNVPRRVIAPHPFQLLDHTQCVYPFGDMKSGDLRFCGEPKAEDSPYCATHHALCHVAAHGDLERMAANGDG